MGTFIMKDVKFFAVGLLALTIGSTESRAQGSGGKAFGFGRVVIDPLGATVKLWINLVNALVLDIGASDFGPTRLDADYLWHFDAFHSHIVRCMLGPDWRLLSAMDMVYIWWQRI